VVLNSGQGARPGGPAARPPHWQGPLVEIERCESDDPRDVLTFLQAHGLGGAPTGQSGDTAVAVLLGARGCAQLAGVPLGPPSPVAIPECVAVAYRKGATGHPVAPAPVDVGDWALSWSDAEHGAAVRAVRDAISRGEVYQANVVGHRSAPVTGDPRAVAEAVCALPGATYGGWLAGEGWLVASASPEQVVRVEGDRVTTVPVKGTSRDAGALRASEKDRAEHVMIVDLARNDLARVTRPGSVEVETLYVVTPWSGLEHAHSRVAGVLQPGTTTGDVLAAVLPGGSVTGAPKHAACDLLAGLEPVGRGPAMGAFGFVWPGGLDLGLTIRTVAVAGGRAHVWAGGGITWSSDPDLEVAEAHAKAAPLLRALSPVGRGRVRTST